MNKNKNQLSLNELDENMPYFHTVSFPNLLGSPKEYSLDSNWLIKSSNNIHQVDVFYLYPTAIDISSKEEIGDINDNVKANAFLAYEKGASCFKDFTNIYIPFYRQMSYITASKINTYSGFLEKIYNSVVRTDVYSALDYFFTHFNKGKPFILAGISQGGYCLQIILSEYMKLHPECYKRMVATYSIGTSFSSSYLKNNPHIKMAKNEKDIGVSIAWNTEAPHGEQKNIFLEEDSYCINPLNWKTDETYAPAFLNKGSYNVETHTITKGIIDAKINLKRRVIVVSTALKHGYKLLPFNLGAGDKSFHLNEWDFFYENIKENAKKRIKEYFKINKKVD